MVLSRGNPDVFCGTRLHFEGPENLHSLELKALRSNSASSFLFSKSENLRTAQVGKDLERPSGPAFKIFYSTFQTQVNCAERKAQV